MSVIGVDRLLTDARATRAIMSKYIDLPEIPRALSHIDGYINNLMSCRNKLATSKARMA